MRRIHFLLDIGKCLFICMIMCSMMLTSCYNDDDLKNSVSGLEDRIGKLEATLQNVQGDISTLKTLTDALAQNKSIASVLENEDGGYTIRFSDKTEITIQNGEDGEDAPQITVIKNEEDGVYYWGITDTNGTKTFLQDGEGNKMPVTAAAPQIRINKETKEWEISTDSGKTWKSTGVYASGEATGDTSLFSEVSQDDDYAYFTLKDGTVLKLSKSKELKCDILSGRQYFANGEEKIIAVEMSGISKYTITKPDGWKASLLGKGLAITAPVSENQYAETSGKVAVLAVAANGQSLISEIPVMIGEAPIVIAVNNQEVPTSLAEGISVYYLGVTDLNEYSPESIAELVNGNFARGYMKTQPLDKVPLKDLLGKELEAGTSYMVWALPASNTSDPYQADDVIGTLIQTSGTVKLEVSDITFEGATITATRKGCTDYYTGITEKEYYSPEDVISDLAFGGGTEQHADYNGALTSGKLDFLTKVNPGMTYVVWAIPSKENRQEYTADELTTVEVAIPALTYNGTATVNVTDVNTTITEVSATLTPGTDCYQFYYTYMIESQLKNYVGDQEIISYLVKSGNSAKEVATLKRASLDPGTKGMIVAVALNSAGQLGTLVKVEANAKELTYNSSIGVAVSVEAGVQSATFTLTPTGTPVKYRYVHMKQSAFKSYPYWGDETVVKLNLSMNEGVTEIDAGALNNNRLVIDGLQVKTDYVLYIIAVDKDGIPSEKMTKITYTSVKPTYVRSTTDDWANKTPTVTVGEIVRNESGKKQFYDFSYTVTPGANVQEFYVLVSSSSLTGMFDEQIQTVMTRGQKVTATGIYSGKATFVSMPTNIYVTWIDTDGKFYEVYKMPVSNTPVE